MGRKTIVSLGLAVLAVGVAAPATAARPPLDPPKQGRLCNAMGVEGDGHGRVRAIRQYASRWAASHVRRLGSSGAFWITAQGRIGCDELIGQLAAVLLARDELTTLQVLGWRVGKVDRLRVDGVPVHQVSATKRGKRISYVRPGGAPEVDGAVYRAGQTLWFDRSRRTCTSAFVVRRPGEGGLLGLSAGHCSDGPAQAPPQYPGGPPIYVTDNVVRHRGSGRSKQTTTLGTVRSNTNLQEAGPDALVFSLGEVPFAAQQIQRGNRTPHRVTGMLPTSQQRKGRIVCFSGYTSGIDQCGRIDGVSTWFGRSVICARAREPLSEHGDSGGPVYTRPKGGTVLAVGIVSRSSIGGLGRDMCYTPIQLILEALGAELPTGSFPVDYRPPR